MSAPFPPSKPGLGPPPSLDGLSSLLSEVNGKQEDGVPSANPRGMHRSGINGTNDKPNGLSSERKESSHSSTSLLSPNHPNNLRKQAKTHLDPSFSVKSYIGAANALLEKARSSDAQGQAEQAFVNYLKSADVAANIPKHADWPKTVEQRGPTYFRYQDFMKNVPDIIQRGHRLEELLKAREEARAEDARNAIQQEKKPFVEKDLEGAVGGTDAVTEEYGQLDSLADRLSALRATSTDRKRMSLAHLPRPAVIQPEHSHDPPGFPSETVNSSLASPQLEKSGFSAITDGVPVGPDMQPTHLATASEFNKSYPTLDDFESRQSRPESPSRPLPVPPTQSSKPSRPPMPPPAKRDITVEELFPVLYPGFDTVQDARLGTKMVRRKSPKVLLLDVRGRQDFDAAHIKSSDIVCIPPALLQQGMSPEDIEYTLHSNSTTEEAYLYQSRSVYDLIVICDKDGRGVFGAVEIVYRAICQDGSRRAPSQSPMFLVGGVDRWSRKVGEQGLQGHSTKRTLQSQPSSSPPVQYRETGSLGESTDSRTKRQAMYVSNPPPAALVPGSSTSASRSRASSYTPSLNVFDSPSVPARTYQSPAGISSASHSLHTRQPHLPPYSYNGMSAASGRQSTSAFDYPQLGGATPTPPAAAAVSANGRLQPAETSHGTSLDIARRPTVPPPGGAPIHTQSRQLSHSIPRVDTNVRVGMTGLKNVGNSCYINSTLQCLSATIPLARFLLDGSYKKAINRSNPLGTQGALAEAFAQLIRVLWSEQYTFVSPVTFREAITRFAPTFRGCDQHDAQEFLAFLLDGLHEDLNYVKTKPPPVEMSEERERELETLPQQIASVKEWAIYRERNDSLIVDWFQGQFRNKLTCLTCGKTSTTYNAFLYLSLPIPPAPRGSGAKVTLAQCLDAFTRDEILDKADAWHCPQCKKPRRATKKLTISRLPQVLLIHLKRFSFKGPFTDKVETNVTFPTSNLDLTNYMPPPLPPGAVPKGMPVSASQQPPYVYDLYGATHHFGSLSGGHYTATIRTQGENGEPLWKYCDDSRITNADDRQIHSSSSYILWWHRKGR